MRRIGVVAALLVVLAGCAVPRVTPPAPPASPAAKADAVLKVVRDFMGAAAHSRQAAEISSSSS